VYGCDICQEVCPWNAARRISLRRGAAAAWDNVAAAELAAQSDDQLALQCAGKAPSGGPKVAGLRRNVAAVLDNASNPPFRVLR